MRVSLPWRKELPVAKVRRAVTEKKLSESEEEDLRERKAAGEPAEALARAFNISEATVYRCINRAAKVEQPAPPVPDDDGEIRRAKQRLELRRIELQAEAMESDPAYREQVLFPAGPKDRPPDAAMVGKVKGFLAEQGLTVVPQQVIDDRERRIQQLEKDLSEVQTQRAQLAERFAEGKTDRGILGDVLSPEGLKVIGQLMGTIFSQNNPQAAAMLIQQMETARAAESPTGTEDPTLTRNQSEVSTLDPRIGALLQLPPARAAEVLVNLAFSGASVAGQSLKDLVQVAVFLEGPKEMAQGLEAFGQGELAGRLRQRPDWTQELLTTLKARCLAPQAPQPPQTPTQAQTAGDSHQEAQEEPASVPSTGL